MLLSEISILNFCVYTNVYREERENNVQNILRRHYINGNIRRKRWDVCWLDVNKKNNKGVTSEFQIFNDFAEF